MLDLAPADDVAHPNIVGRIQEGHGRVRAPYQARDMIGIARIPAQQAVAPQLPEVPRFAHRSGRGPLGIDRVIRIGCVLLEVDHELVDLDRRETGDRDIETFHDQDLSQGRQLDCQTLAIPAGTFGNPIVSKSEGAPLGLRQPPHLDRGDLLEIEQSGRGIAAMAGNDDAVIVDQNRNDKSECGDAVGNLTDLLARMGARVTTVRRELVDRSPADINHEFLNGRQGERVRADLRRYRPICLGSSGSDHIHADRIALLLVLTAL